MLAMLVAIITATNEPVDLNTLPAIVRADIEYTREMCRALGKRMEIDDAYIEQTDFNEDGVIDYIFDLRGVSCGKENAALFNSREGTPVYVYMSNDKGDWDKAYNAYMFEYQVKKEYGQSPYFDVWVRGEVGYQVVYQRFQWNDGKFIVIDQEIGAQVPDQLWKKFD